MKRLAGFVAVLVSSLLVMFGSPQPAFSIYAGEDADMSEFPWMVSVQLENSNGEWVHVCGGTLVKEDWVLTAAHCVFDGVKSPNGKVLASDKLRLVVGLDKPDWSPQAVVQVAEVVSHPGYLGKGDSEADIALLRLAQPVDGPEDPDPVALGYGEMPVGTLLTTVGWGSTADSFESRVDPQQLQKMDDIRVQEDTKCWDSPDFVRVAPTSICTKQQDTLDIKLGGPRPGDSGGPLLLWFNERWFQLGVASHLPRYCDEEEQDCGFEFLNATTRDGDPNFTAWASVKAHRPWIDGVIAGGSPTPGSDVAAALVIDSSGSMTSNDRLGSRLQAAKAYISAALPSDEVGVIDFDSSARVAAPATRVEGNRALLNAAVDSIDSRGGTNLGAGLQSGCDVLKSASAVRRAAIFLTDGQGSYSGQSSCFADEGWPVFTVGLGSGVNATILEQIASDTGGSYLPLPTPEVLACEFQQIRSEIAGLGRTSDCQPTGTISQDETVSFMQTVQALLKQFTFTNVWPGSDIEMTVTSPSGRQISRSTTASDVVISVGPTSESFTIANPEAGDWQVTLTGTDIPQPDEPYTYSTVSIPLADSEIDSDADGRVDPDDNCAYTPNPAQSDTDGDGFGDECDTDPGLDVNQTPSADAGGPYTGTEGLPVTLDASASSDPDGDALEYRWDIGADGNYEFDWSPEPTAQYTWDDQYDGQVMLQVRDPGGASSDAAATVTIANGVPSVTLTTDDATAEGQSFTMQIDVSDPGVDDEVSLTVSWGDGREESVALGTDRQRTVTHTYVDDDPTGTPADPATITVEASDGDGGTASTDRQIMVDNIAPSTLITSVTDLSGASVADRSRVALVGLPVDMEATFTDPGQTDTHTATIDWGDGGTPNTPASSAIAGTHVFASTGAATITVTVVDDDTGVGEADTTVMVVDASGAADSVVEAIQQLIAGGGLSDAAAVQLQTAIDKLEGNQNGRAANGAKKLLAKGNIVAALAKFEHAVVALQAASQFGGPDTADLQSLLALAVKSQALQLVQQADLVADSTRSQRTLARAAGDIANGENAFESGDLLAAVDDWQSASRTVLSILR